MSTLNEIEFRIMRLLSVPEEMEEGETAEALDALNDLAIRESEKIDGISFAIRKRKSEIEFLKAEEKRIKGLRQSMEKRLEEFRAYLQSLMEYHKLKKIKGSKGTLFLKDMESVCVDDQDALPDEYIEKIIEYRAKKAEIKLAIKAGVAVPGAQLVKKSVINIR